MAHGRRHQTISEIAPVLASPMGQWTPLRHVITPCRSPSNCRVIRGSKI
ncbi:hypothetical protein HMPREF9601_01348 [Cutibacterium acnes HL030PA1]|nr:hypothetical protein HMPREF9621_02330 [Cutibacterium modestum HL037PA2]EFT64211.1 hypothetical protein HMPREF9578_02116 [Cutibacterium acnes HL110PA4]EFT78453.1 hypothetical protein HMPREF9601_01348 [Cutibacterium acnes HL030PA1]